MQYPTYLLFVAITFTLQVVQVSIARIYNHDVAKRKHGEKPSGS